MSAAEATVDRLDAAAFTVPTGAPESDGTLTWDSTTMVVVEAHGGGERGLGYTYGPPAAGHLVTDTLAGVVQGSDALSPPTAWSAMRSALRNAGQAGIGALAVSAIDIALHDLRARLLGLPLAAALGAFRDAVPAYGSGGFCTYGPSAVAEQLGGWAADGFRSVKLKVGRAPDEDPARLDAARTAVGGDVELMVDANGAFDPSTALAWAERYRAWDVAWLEEPVSSDDLAGLRHVRDAAPPGLAVAAGEYGWSPIDAERMLDAGAVDVLQADVTRCGGITGLRRIDALCGARSRPFSAHCAPALSAHAGRLMKTIRHVEYFHDHVRLEGMLLDGVPAASGGVLRTDETRPGLGLELKRADAERFLVWRS
jgi:L-alanine-DL-glutamate epimerase-like enolase superfamily enzyme